MIVLSLKNGKYNKCIYYVYIIGCCRFNIYTHFSAAAVFHRHTVTQRALKHDRSLQPLATKSRAERSLGQRSRASPEARSSHRGAASC